MGYLTVNSRGRLTSALGESFFNKVLGITGDHIKRYEDQGWSLSKIFYTWKNTLDRYTAEAKRIPTGSGEKRLRDQYTALYAQAAKLEPSFAPGASQGSVTRDMVNTFVAGVKAFGADKQALLKQYGLAPLPKGAVPPTQQAGLGGGIPLWGWILAGLALAKGMKKK